MRDSGQRGFALITLLLALAAIAFLYFTILAPGNAKGGAPEPALDLRQAPPVGLAGACRGNRQELQRSFLTWSITHPGQTPTLAAIRASGFEVPNCPGGGIYSVKEQLVECSVHSAD